MEIRLQMSKALNAVTVCLYLIQLSQFIKDFSTGIDTTLESG